jgi:hypothetical protein
MTEFFFPDNTVLCNFAAVDRLDLLKTIANGRGRWREAVAHEASRSATVWPALAALLAAGWLDDPIEIADEADVLAIERIRRATFAQRGDGPRKHLGEAQACYVIKNWKQFSGAWWITDDRDALRYARFQGITTRETADLVAIAAVNGGITPADGFALLNRMTECDRVLRLPSTAADLVRL